MRPRPLTMSLFATALVGLCGQAVAAPVSSGRAKSAKTEDGPLPPGAVARLGSERLRHGGLIMTVAFLAEDKLLSAGIEGVFRVWDAKTGKEVRRFGTPGLPPRVVAISPDGKVAASSYEDRTAPMQLWDVTTGKARLGPAPAGFPVPPPQIVNLLAFSPDSKMLLTSVTRGGIALWDVATGKRVREFESKRKHSCSVAFSPDGRWLVSGEFDGTLYVWKVVTGEKVRVLQTRSRVYGVAFAPDGKTFASSDGNGVALWKTATGESVWRSQGHQQPVRSVTFTPDGKTLLSRDFAGTGRAWDVASGRAVTRLAAFLKGTSALVFSPDRKKVAGVAGHRVRLWEVASGRELLPQQGTQGDVLALAFSPDGRTLASVGRDHVICLWDVPARALLRRLEGHTWDVGALAFSPDGKTLASTSAEPKDALRLWDVSTGKKLLRVRSKHIAGFISVAFSTDNRSVATGGLDHTVRLWESATGKELRTFPFRPRLPYRLFFSADGRSLTATSYGPIISTWSVRTGVERLNVRSKKGFAFGAAVSAGGRSLAGADNEHVYVLEMATGKERARIAHGEKEGVGALTFSPDGKRVIGALSSQALCVWDPLSGREVGRVPELASAATALVCSLDGKTLASGFRDGTILLWDVDRLPKPKRAALQEPSATEVKAQWQALQGEDTTRAFRALALLRTAPRQVLPLLRRDLRPAPPLDSKRIAQLVADLDNKRFAVREKATAELARLGQQAEAALLKALEANPPDEVRRRLKGLLEPAAPAIDRLRTLRMLELLEQIGTPEGRELLKTLADNKSDSWLAAEARAAEERLYRRGGR